MTARLVRPVIAPWHEFNEDPDDLSMCRCGVPGLIHERVYPDRADVAAAVPLPKDES